MSECAECGDPIETWGVVKLCDRCLCARLWEELEKDDYLLVRRHPNGDISVKSRIDGDQNWTNATALKIDVRAWLEERLTVFV